MISKEFERVIEIINEKMETKNIKWALVGSTNLAIQGMNVKPRDLDIVIQLSNLKKIKSVFSGYEVSEIKKLKPLTKEPAWEIKMMIGNIEVQILGEKNSGEYVRKLLANKLIKVKMDGVEVPCFSLEDEAQTYEKTNRKHKADLINNFLRSTTSL